MSPVCPAFSLLYCPLSPQPPSPAGKGENQSFLMQGASPLASPELGGTRHLHDQRFLFVYGGQCRQPRRGGTGGEELRRLRWSSPPGQGEQVPLGFSPVGHRQRPPRLQRRSNPPRHGGTPRRRKKANAAEILPKPVDKHRADMVQYKQPGGMPSAGKRAWNAIGKA